MTDLEAILIVKDAFKYEIREMRKNYCMKKFGVNYPEERLHYDYSLGYTNEDEVDLMRRDVDLYELTNLCNLEGIIDHSINKTAEFIKSCEEDGNKLMDRDVQEKIESRKNSYKVLGTFYKMFGSGLP